AHFSTSANLVHLQQKGVHVIPAQDGELASGLRGKGRMTEPEDIAQYLQRYFASKMQHFSSKKVLITAGPSYEAIDPVRFIGNHSTGKMGIALANAFASSGAEVTLLL